ncbi:MAG: MFS transporter, partial [Calditrichales bacterium]
MLSTEDIKRGLKFSIAEGFFAHMYANLTGSVFLPAFALLLMASDLTIGFLASIPFFATIAQVLGSLIVERYRQRKKTALIMAFISRMLWLPVIVLTFFLFDENRDLLLTLVISIIIVHHIFGSISGVAWLSWMSSLVPPAIRGRFFGLRNSFLGIVTIVITLVGGVFLDWFRNTFPAIPLSWSFMILFFVAVVFGAISTILLSRQPDIEEPVRDPVSLRTMFSGPFQNIAFRKLIRFAVLWSFAVNFASPFYIVYMIRDLALSYTLVSAMAIFSALADLFGMGFWGHFSDKHGNRPVVIISAVMGAILPSLWIFTVNSTFSLLFLIPVLH